ncbi:unnamed protein product [Paramecium primaurelia]|uniref:Uncharacterized protein n=1 Tax=Paramecium primaurelia TaxID=5886 RepID=A0A8S1NG35_PARPR|nr:unnamed protein product [Paramecium primaurelia]
MLKLKTSQQTNKQITKPENMTIVKKDDPKTSIDHDEEQDETNLVEVAKKSEKKQPTIQQTKNDGWQQSDDPKDLPTNGIGKKTAASFKKQDEPVIEIRNEEFPDIATVDDMTKPTKKQKKMNIQPKQDQPIQTATNNAGLFTNSSSKTQPQTTANIQTKNIQLNSNSGSLTFTNTKKQEHTAYFQQQQQESIKSSQKEESQAQPKIQETQKSYPSKQVNLSRNTNTVSQQVVNEQQKQIKVEESIPTFINSKAKGNPPVVSQQQQQLKEQQSQQQQQQQQQINDDEDSDGWETVEKKRKAKGSFQRNQKQT